tara:strand:+ start:706 stop:1584 length:879 start_codon:yes stop_codon:yes gene_type:complete
MNKEILKYIKNKNLRISSNEKFVAIIGSNPSKNARSPKLWNRVYKKLKRKMVMYPLDVNSNNVIKLVNFLNKNKNFLGGSITIPFKEKIFKILKKNSTKEAKKISAVNCLFRDKKGLLKVTNTDGEASLTSFKKKFKNAQIKNILVMGCGGAGKAVSTYFSKISSLKKITILSRKTEDQKFAKKIRASWLNRKNLPNLELSYDLIINCTSLGFDKKKNKISLPISFFSNINKKTIIYDVIYKPIKTKLIKISEKNGLKTINGLGMNLEQAAIAFSYVNRTRKIEVIKKIMNG